MNNSSKNEEVQVREFERQKYGKREREREYQIFYLVLRPNIKRERGIGRDTDMRERWSWSK